MAGRIPYPLIDGLPEPERSYVYQNFEDLDQRVQVLESDVAVLDEQSATPTSPTQDNQAVTYIKANKFVIAWNDAGTIRYKYLDLTGTGVTWVHTTVAP